MIQFDLIKKGLDRISEDSDVPFETVLGAAASILAQNLGESESKRMLDAALTLTKETDLDSQESVDTLTNVITNFVSENVSPLDIVARLDEIKNDISETDDISPIAKGLSATSLIARNSGVDLDSLVELLLASKATSPTDFEYINAILSTLQSPNTIDRLKTVGVKTDRGHSFLKKLSSIAFAIVEARTGIDASGIAGLLFGKNGDKSLGLINNITTRYTGEKELSESIPIREQVAADLYALARKYEI